MIPGFFLFFFLLTCAQKEEEKKPFTIPEVTFPEKFLFGTASSAYQVEGNYDPFSGPLKSNWSRWEEMGKIFNNQKNDRGSNFYELFREDLARHKELNLNAIRIGISWERVEPEPHRFSPEALAYYKEVVKTAHEMGLTVILTLYHWVVPRWVADPIYPPGDPRRDAFAIRKNTWLYEVFREFVEKVGETVGPYVDSYILLNEPWIVMVSTYIAPLFPPGEAIQFEKAQNLGENFLYLASIGKEALKKTDLWDADGDGKPVRTGVAFSAGELLPMNPKDPRDRKGAETLNYLYNDLLLYGWVEGKVDYNWDGKVDYEDPSLRSTLDFIGINFYGPTFVLGFETNLFLSGLPLARIVPGALGGYPLTENFLPIRPPLFIATLERYSRFGLPILITENGTADCDDNQRPRYIVEHLYALGLAMEEGIPVEGYLHWSLTDNFEWVEGFHQCFGLYKVDFSTYTRTPRTSAEIYKEIVTKRKIGEEELKKGFSLGYDGDTTGRSLEDVVKEMVEEARNGKDQRSVYTP